MKKILILGKNSFIASHLKYPKADERFPANKNEIEKILDSHLPDVIINCIAYCGNKNVDDCEINKEKTIETNLTIPTIIADYTNRHDIQLIQISSGCVNYGDSPHTKFVDGKKIDSGWKETDFSNPQAMYSRSKYACDLVLSQYKNVLLPRLRMPLSGSSNSRNLISKLIKYSKVLIEPNSITFVDDLVRFIDFAIDKNLTGIYNVNNSLPTTHDMILDEYKKYVPSHSYEKIGVEELSKLTTAKRSNCILDNSKLLGTGFEMTDSLTAIKLSVKEYINNIKKEKNE